MAFAWENKLRWRDFVRGRACFMEKRVLFEEITCDIVFFPVTG